MKIKELISKLQMFDQNLTVVVDGYEGGVTVKFDISEKTIKTDVHKEWYYGESEIDETGDSKVLYLQRERLSDDRDFV